MTYQQLLKWHIEAIQGETLRNVCFELLNYDAFFEWPASLGFHHAYRGGLIEHTFEVCLIAKHIAASQHITPTSKDIIIASCLWHDLLKIDEYLPVLNRIEGKRCLPFKYGDFNGFLIKDSDRDSDHSHIIDGAERFVETAEKYNLSPVLTQPIEHCILSHHGHVKEWGSPIAPKTLEANIVHMADMLSAHSGKTK
jgi:3'-5' exoribonuclease